MTGGRPDQDGWVKVGPTKGQIHRAKKIAEQREKALRADVEKDKTVFSSLEKQKKNNNSYHAEGSSRPYSQPDPDTRNNNNNNNNNNISSVTPAPQKTEKSATEKIEARKQKKKKKKEEELVKQQSPTALLKKTANLLPHIAANPPEDVLESLQKLPEQYPGRVKDQFQTAVIILNDLFPAGTQISKSYKNLKLQEKWAQPMLSDKTGALTAALVAIIDQSTDNAMWNSLLRELAQNTFGRDGTRPDDGAHYLGSKFALQVLLRHNSGAFAFRPDLVETMFFHERGIMSQIPSLNFSWILAQIQGPGVSDAVSCWGRVYLPRIVDNETGSVVTSGVELSELFLKSDPCESDKKAYLNKTKHKEPFNKEVFTILTELSKPRKSDLLQNIFKKIFWKYSVLYTPFSPQKYFLKLTQQLKTASPTTKQLILEALVESIVLDSVCLYIWSSDLQVIMKESVDVLEYLYSKQSSLRKRLDGEEMSTFFDKITSQCQDILDKKENVASPSGKKAKSVSFTEEDVQKVKQCIRKVSGLTKAVATEAPASKKSQKKKKPTSAPRFSFFSLFFLLLVFVGLGSFLAFPYLPPEQQELVKGQLQIAQKFATEQYLLIKEKLQQ